MKNQHIFILIHPYTADIVGQFYTIGHATTQAIKKNRASDDQPAYRLYRIRRGGKPAFMGELWRDFGCDFDEKNCWRK